MLPSGTWYRPDTFFARLDTNGTIAYATYLGGSGEDFAYALAVDSSGRLYSAGEAGSTDFPAVQALPLGATGGTDLFVTRLSAAGAVQFSSRFGGVEDEGARGLSIAGNVVTVTGTAFGAAFPLVNAPGMPALPTDVTLYVRVGSRVGGVWRYSMSIPFTAARMAATLIYPTVNATGVVTTRAFEWTPVPGADAYILHIGTAPNTWNLLAAGLLTSPSYLVTTTLPAGPRLYARVGARVGGVWRWSTNVPFTAAP